MPEHYTREQSIAAALRMLLQRPKRFPRDPEAPIGRAETSQWKCGCGTEVPKRHVSAMRAAVRVTLDRFAPHVLYEPAFPLYCESCSKFVGWTCAPESHATLERDRRMRWLAESAEFGPDHLVGVCVEQLARWQSYAALRAHIRLQRVRAWWRRSQWSHDAANPFEQ